MRKKIIFGFLLFNVTIYSQSKIVYSYDQAGNRELKTIYIETRSAGSLVNQQSSTIEETLSTKKIKLYPNPVKTSLTVEISDSDNELTGQILLFDLTGRLILQKSIETSVQIVDMSTLNKGTYIMKLVLMKEYTTWKVIKE
ncbi:MAG TPA: T9SS type A sorting domain-containing protein [Macellibacteroides fermentans]|uniref:T9SS type A sorting domain-containing protein n=1 Tax=Macellibacteroides fermentans TaxID=879969 RepID=UPI002BE002D0|nr:T9SS type A sorting domain-containing protein [Macellibacteroides fermentans]